MNIIRTLIRAATAATITGGTFAMPLGAFLLHEQTVEQWTVETSDSSREASLAYWVLPTAEAAPPPAVESALADAEVTPESTASELAIAGSAGTPIAKRADASTGLPGPSRASVRKAARDAEAAEAEKKRKKKGVVCEESHETIDRVAGHTWAVERDLLTFYARHPGKLDDLGWVARHKDDEGDANGFRLGGIQCGSELLSAGFQNGDIVHSVNGRTISSVGQALLAWAALKRAETLTVVISRRGKSKTLVYHLA